MTPWTIAHQASLSMGFSRQEYWSGLPFRSPGNLPNPGIEPGSPALQADSSLSEPLGKPILLNLQFSTNQSINLAVCVCVCVCVVCVCVCTHVCVLSHFWLLAIPWTVVHQDLLFVRFSRQEYWSGLPLPSPGYRLNTTQSKPQQPCYRKWQADSVIHM